MNGRTRVPTDGQIAAMLDGVALPPPPPIPPGLLARTVQTPLPIPRLLPPEQVEPRKRFWHESTLDPIPWRPLPEWVVKSMVLDRAYRMIDEGLINGNDHYRFKRIVERFYNYKTGWFAPSKQNMADLIKKDIKTVDRLLNKLRDLGLIFWVNRLTRDKATGQLRPTSNAYFLRTKYCPPPPPDPGTWGDHPLGQRDVFEEVKAEAKDGGDFESKMRQLENDPTCRLAVVTARLFRLVQDREKSKGP